MNKFHRAWGVCLGCALLFFCTSGLVTNAFSIYLPYILSWNHFSNTQISNMVTIRNLSSFIAMFLTGYYYRIFSLKKGMVLSGLFVVAGFLLYGIAQTYPLYLLAAVVIGTGYGFGSMVPIGMILNRWFHSRLSFATGLCACVTGMSTLGLPTLITILIARIGLGKTFIVEGIFILILIIFCAFLLVSSPEEIGCSPYSEEETVKVTVVPVKHKKNRNIQVSSNRYRPILSGPVWFLAFPMMLLLGSYTSTAYGYLSVLMTGEGISTSAAAIVILLSGIAIIFSKFSYGWLADRVSAYSSNWLFGFLTIAGLAFCQFAKGNAVFMGISLIIYSLGLGMSTVGIVVWAKELSSDDAFEKNNRYFQTLYAAGALIFSYMPGRVADHFGGSYLPAYLIFTAAAIFVLISIQIIYKKARI